MRRRRGPAPERDAVDAVPRLRALVPLGVQHVLVAYSGLLTVPLLIGTGIGLSPDRIAALISANLFVSGLATVLQSAGVLNVGVRLPVVMGSTFTGIGPAILVGQWAGPAAVFGATMAAGALTFLAAPCFGRLLRFFPPVVTGTVIGIIGLSLVPSAGKMIAGDAETVPLAPALLALATVVCVVLVERFAPPSVGRLAVLVALAAGTAAAFPLGLVDLSGVGAADTFGPVVPFAFGPPEFALAAVVPFVIVQLVNMVETTGDTLAVGSVVGRRVGPDGIARALRADGLATLFSGVFNSFTMVTHSANVGMVNLTKVYSRWVVAFSGLLMAVLGLMPVLGALVAALPGPVLGGVGMVMFAMVGSVGIRILRDADLSDQRTLLIIAVSFGVALLPLGAPGLYGAFPDALRTVMESGIAAGAITAFLLNLLLFGVPRDTPGTAGADDAADTADTPSDAPATPETPESRSGPSGEEGGQER
ncbi:nucleobase:cation symporter-2 family protein [Nocardiopsis suaedae]|uniref:Nucleobase:cation symporter-2 family protein n=1 Tax=Nocardiopsis suaedae TaxID=3018444 RepID=A0ABT4TUN4_9ACTN|nr:nucleobase:cation symporter-2 family protein [Nocardiopsis suaedae]MDA2808424.1 nucleobase:cation symporter-2 family protein [Nocardiopsis suaedae]